MTSYYIYDLETYPNIFTFCGKFVGSNEVQLWEISDRLNERDLIIQMMRYLKSINAEMIGFNNLGFDYPIMHEMMMNPYMFDARKASQLANQIIHGQRGGQGGLNTYIAPRDRFVDQIDLVKVNHFDNKAKRTSLKALQFAMRSTSLEDLPFDIRDLTHEEMNQLRDYNIHDVTETESFFNKCEPLIDMRRELSLQTIVDPRDVETLNCFKDDPTIPWVARRIKAMPGDVLNYSDVKIGVEYLTNRIGRNKCYVNRKPRQTFREMIDLGSVILPKISFRTEPFQEVFSWFKQQKFHIRAESKPKLEVELGGLKFDFGVGGVHASVDNKVYKSNDEYQIIDIDVAGMYVAVAIANKFAPEHLGQDFVTAYTEIQSDRKKHAKGTSMNALLKLAGNGVYGNSNNPYSCFYDPLYTFSVTTNGQLQLLQLVELLVMIPGLELIQANTDGITAYVPRENQALFKMWCDIWEEMTGLVLEEVLYSRMWIRDVNNYMAETEDGKIKRKGAYAYPTCEKDYEGWWNKDYSNLASKMAVEKVMTHSWPVETAIRLISNPFDFMLRYKATGGSQLYIGDVKQLKTVRYYVSTEGEAMKKVSKPKGEVGQYKRKNKLKDSFFNQVMKEIGKDVWDERVHTKNKSKYGKVETSVQSGWKVKQCNLASDFNWADVEWDYYIQESKKLIIGSK